MQSFVQSALAALALAFSVVAFAPRSTAQTIPEITFTAQSQWSSGFTCDVAIKNRSTTTINGWTLVFSWPPQISSVWNGILSGQTGNTLTVGNESWNGSIAPGQTVSFGFTAQGTFTQNVAGCTLNGGPTDVVYATGGSPGGGTGGGSTGFVVVSGIGNDQPSMSISGVAPTVATLSLSNAQTPTGFAAEVSNSTVLSATVVGSQLVLTPIRSGFSGLRIRETGTNAVRHLGIAVREKSEAMPGMPDYVAIGSVSEDTTNQLDFWKSFASGDQNRRMDIRYIYINGGPISGWRTWTPTPGARAANYVRESKKLGFIPYFVYYNVPDGGESFYTDSQHLFSSSYMAAYYQDLTFFLKLIAQETADGWPVGIILEPDLLGYMAQNSLAPNQASWSIPGGGSGTVQTSAAYSTLDFDGAPILTVGQDPAFPNDLRGFVESVNYLIRKKAPQAVFGWQMNLWASPPNGFTGTGIPGNGIIRKTDTAGIVLGRAQITAEANAITQWYVNAGVTTWGASFLSIDKYGLDAGAEGPTAISNPASSIWFWNTDHWGNYLLFVESMHLVGRLPVVLWQIPVGHINASQAPSPYDPSGLFPPLANVYQGYEDSAGTYFLGDTFTTSGNRAAYFATNLGQDPGVTQSGGQITWAPHLSDAAAKGVVAILFGAGVAASTQGIPAGTSSSNVPTDAHWWITKIQRSYIAGTTLLSASTDMSIAWVTPGVIAPMTPAAPNVTLSIAGQGFDRSSVVHAGQTPLATTFVSPQSLSATLPGSLPSAQFPGAISIAVKNSARRSSHAVPLSVTTSGNQGFLALSPIAPVPGQPFALTIEGVPAAMPYSLLADFSLAPPITGFPSAAANLTIAVSPATLFSVTDGLGLFGPSSGAAFVLDADAPTPGGVAGIPGLTMPLPPLGAIATLQAVYLDPSSPIGLRLTHGLRLSF